MLYNEFLQGTECKDTPFNYKVYQNLEALYMESETMTKDDVYKAGKILVDNSETEQEKATRERVQKEVKELAEYIEYYQNDIARYEYFIRTGKDTERAETLKAWRGEVKWRKAEIKKRDRQIKAIRQLFRECF